MPRIRRMLGRRIGPMGIALTAIDVWRRIPPRHRRRIVAETRKQLPRLAKKAAASRRRRRRR
ncbi:MAG TPA: hypothetical protein VGQ68_09760 [Gaiellaceae bacterium]|nr:hypothetical protein [Gaiellaceae bacterium]